MEIEEEVKNPVLPINPNKLEFQTSPCLNYFNPEIQMFVHPNNTMHDQVENID